MDAADFAVGCRLAIKTTIGDDIEGQVLTFDKLSSVVVLQEIGSAGSRRNLRFLRTDYIKDSTVLGQVDEPFDLTNSFLDINSLRVREENAIRQAELETERIGVGVSHEAQDIFDELSKTLPVKWEKTTIIVLDEVRVSNPYSADSVSGGSQNANEYVRKMVDGIWMRLQSRGV